LFAGVALDGSILAIDTKSNKGLYGKDAPATDIIAGKVTTDADSANRFERAILASTAGHAPASSAAPAAAQPAPAPAPAAGTKGPAAPAGSGNLPIEDAQPGAEPPR